MIQGRVIRLSDYTPLARVSSGYYIDLSEAAAPCHIWNN
jgi:hypothetical protein